MDHLIIAFTLLLVSLTLGAPILIFAAELLGKRDWLGLSLMMIAVSMGVIFPTVLIVLGASLMELPLSKIAGIFIFLIGLWVFFGGNNVGDERKLTKRDRMEAVTTAFFVSLPPGLFSITAAEGIVSHDYIKVALVAIIGPASILIGAPIYLYSIKLLKPPIHKIAGLLVIVMSLIMIIGK